MTSTFAGENAGIGGVLVGEQQEVKLMAEG
jgi:hypothetical protein